MSINEIKQLSSISELQTSKHATDRMNERGVDFTENLQLELQKAVDKAREKGASNDVVVIGRDNAFIVNVKNNTIVTTMDLLEMKEHVFTNIDSAVIM